MLAFALVLLGLVLLGLGVSRAQAHHTPWRYEREYARPTLKWRYQLWRHRVVHLKLGHGFVGPDLVRRRKPLHGPLRPHKYRRRVWRAIGSYKTIVAKHPHKHRPGYWRIVDATAYCLTGIMANGERVHPGAVAMNLLPLGTHITVSDSPWPGHWFTVHDRIGWGTELDYWTASCSWARQWGRHRVKVWIGWW